MIPIYLCEDQREFLDDITQLVEKITIINDFHFNIKLATQNPGELYEIIKESPQQGIYFLDVDLGKSVMNGFELGKKIRAIDPRGFIIYVTTHDELLLETFKYRLEALDYIVKDEPEKLSESITACLEEINKRMASDLRESREYFAVEKGARTTYVPVEEILYFETTSKKHVIAIVTKDVVIEFYGNLSDIEGKLGKDFLRVHRSYLVNIIHIKFCDYKKRELYLSFDRKCDIARGKFKEMFQKLCKEFV